MSQDASPQPAPEQGPALNFGVSHGVVPGPDGQPWVLLQMELNGVAIQAMKFPAPLVPQIIELVVANLQQGLTKAQMQQGIVPAGAAALAQLPPAERLMRGVPGPLPGANGRQHGQ